ncbi:unnamed protein product [Schistosoma margrebowiei]|uniref:Uncharacterized protein n=1 Tax=Schistosoma margrebowiei TaxID=48269 RepID=A0A183M9I0_9TREM|nr:unnamed protein product [Schistosoma margrebowiei]
MNQLQFNFIIKFHKHVNVVKHVQHFLIVN